MHALFRLGASAYFVWPDPRGITIQQRLLIGHLWTVASEFPSHFLAASSRAFLWQDQRCKKSYLDLTIKKHKTYTKDKSETYYAGELKMGRRVPVYTITTVSSLTGFSPRQLRYYETIGILAPSRTKGRHRLYSPEEVDRLIALRGLLAQGLNLAGAKSVLAGAVEPPFHLGEETRVPLIDHTALTKALQQGNSLNSLFPVRDQQTLYRLLLRLHGGQEPEA